MDLSQEYIYQISVEDDDGYSVIGLGGKKSFVAPVTQRLPKLYVFSAEGKILYVGQTVQGMSARIRLGFKANGADGYWGYRWRKVLKKARLHIWCLNGISEEDELEALECIESEVVFRYRTKQNQWPEYQTEIHFHESSSRHRELASEIYHSVQENA